MRSLHRESRRIGGTVFRARVLEFAGARVSLGLLSVMVMCAITAPWISPYDPQQLLDPIALRSQLPTWAHPLGTDPYSRDILSRLLAGARVSLALSVAAVAMSTLSGVMVGLCSATMGGRTDRLLMRVTDVGLSVPRVLLLLTMVGVWGAPSMGVLVVVLGLTGWMSLARLVRSELLALRQHDRILAAHAIGLHPLRILRDHLLPTVAPLIVVSATMAIGQVLLLESGLSFLGIGVPAPLASWGTILLDVGDVIGPGRWLAIGPGVVLVATVVSVQRVGEARASAMGVRSPS